MRVVVDPIAEMQLDALHQYITQSSGYEERADGYITRILKFCHSLETFPERGMRHDALRPGLRLIGFEERVTVAFTVQNNDVIILGIFYGGQNIEAFYSDEEK